MVVRMDKNKVGMKAAWLAVWKAVLLDDYMAALLVVVMVDPMV
jgi:hypothetical protein